MIDYFSKIKEYLLDDICISIIPSPSKGVKTLRFKKIIPITIILIIIVSISMLSYLYNYYEINYTIVSDKIEELRDVREENQKLKAEFYDLAEDTENLKQSFLQLKEYNNTIKKLIDVSEETKDSIDKDIAEKNENNELRLYTSFSNDTSVFQSGMPIGGGELELNYRFSSNVIQRTKENLDLLKSELPEQKKSLDDLHLSVNEYNQLKAATPTIWPLDDNGDAFISSEFGWRADPFTGEQQLHEGLDIGVWYNTPVLATADGVVKFVGRNGGYGLLVTIEHGFGYETRYAHLNKIKVKKGQKVSRGDIVALSGNSGRSNGPHLHYEVILNNIPKNPVNFIGR
ncbi:MAG: peptidoglycan DD-metalloendopeptidase family protein [Halanaerobiaceae bacterium]